MFENKPFELTQLQKDTANAVNAVSAAITKLNDCIKGMEYPMFEPIAPFAGVWQLRAPCVVAQMLMAQLSFPDTFDDEEKAFWLRVGAELGPDWLAKFRRVGAFMKMAESA